MTESSKTPNSKDGKLFMFENCDEVNTFLTYANLLTYTSHYKTDPNIIYPCQLKLDVGADILDWYMHVLCKQPTGAPYTLKGFEIRDILTAPKYRKAIRIVFEEVCA